MKINFQRSGGLAGMLVQLSIDTGSLPPDKADHLHNSVKKANFFDLPARLDSPIDASDQFQYVITVEQGNRRHTVEASDGAAPATLWPLLRELTLLARSQSS
jgi:hypothetical protein